MHKTSTAVGNFRFIANLAPPLRARAPLRLTKATPPQPAAVLYCACVLTFVPSLAPGGELCRHGAGRSVAYLATIIEYIRNLIETVSFRSFSHS